MRNYLIEDLSEADLEKIENALKDKGYVGGLDGIYYLPLPDDLRTDVQREHADQCGPHICVLEALPDQGALKLELLVRARKKLRCECVFYATPAQREHIMNFLDSFIRELDIAV